MPRECVQCTSKHTVHIVNVARAPWADHAPHEHAVHPMTVMDRAPCLGPPAVGLTRLCHRTNSLCTTRTGGRP